MTAPNKHAKFTGSALSVFALNRFQLISPAQMRAARGLMNWGRSELALAADLSPETIKNIEHGVFNPQEQTAFAILQTFSRHGVEFFSLPFLNVVGVTLNIPKTEKTDS